MAHKLIIIEFVKDLLPDAPIIRDKAGAEECAMVGGQPKSTDVKWLEDNLKEPNPN